MCGKMLQLSDDQGRETRIYYLAAPLMRPEHILRWQEDLRAGVLRMHYRPLDARPCLYWRTDKVRTLEALLEAAASWPGLRLALLTHALHEGLTRAIALGRRGVHARQIIWQADAMYFPADLLLDPVPWLRALVAGKWHSERDTPQEHAGHEPVILQILLLPYECVQEKGGVASCVAASEESIETAGTPSDVSVEPRAGSGTAERSASRSRRASDPAGAAEEPRGSSSGAYDGSGDELLTVSDHAASAYFRWLIETLNGELEGLGTDIRVPESCFALVGDPERLLDAWRAIEPRLTSLFRRTLRHHRRRRRVERHQHRLRSVLRPRQSGAKELQREESSRRRRKRAARSDEIARRQVMWLLVILAHLAVWLLTFLWLWRHRTPTNPSSGGLPEPLPGVSPAVIVVAVSLLLALDARLLLKRTRRDTSHASPEQGGVMRHARDSAARSEDADASFTDGDDLPALHPDRAIRPARLTRLRVPPRIGRRLRTHGLSEEGEAVITVRDYYIGSDPKRCDLCLAHPSVAPLHARIFQRQDTFYLTDLSDRGGTELEGRLLVRHEDYILPASCRLSFGKLSFRFERE